MSKLVFTAQGTTLLHSFNESVLIWDIVNCQLRYKTPGTLLGVARDGKIFQTTEGFWDIDEGTKLDSAPKIHNWHQRLYISQISTIKDEKKSYSLEIIDSSGVRPRQLIHIADLGLQGGLDVGDQVIDPNGQYIAVYLYVSILGHDLDQIKCYDLSTGEEVYTFIDKDVSFSGIHNLMFVTSRSNVEVYNLLTNQRLELKVSSSNVATPTIRINPKDDTFAAAINKKNSIIFLGRDIYQASSRKTIQKRKLKILDIAFNPDGSRIAGSLSNSEVHIWNVKTCKLTTKLVI